jgi:N utilization substance protein A
MAREFINKEFIEALEDLETERGIKAEVVLDALEAALISAYKKHFGSSQNVRVEINRDTGEIHVYFRKTVVEEVEDERVEMSLAEARLLDPEFEVGDMFESEVTPRSFGRIAAQTAKQVVVQRIREAERGMVYDAFAGREGDIVTGLITRIEGRNIIVDLGKTDALLPSSEQIPGEKYEVGQRIKVYLGEVRKANRGAQVIISRTNPGLLRRLLEQEIPEIYDGTVEVKGVVREPGSRSKVAVYSENENIDAVGACVGAKGIRVQSIVNELAGEKLEVIEWSQDLSKFISNAISPAKALEVILSDDEKSAKVVVPDDQLSLAIGKEGQNARLAVRLTSCKIDIKSQSQMAAIRKKEEEAALVDDLEDEAELITDSISIEDAVEENIIDNDSENMEVEMQK